ncbi:hypothetical protein LWI28_000372 [Acer negundo]|uniref:Uncharacterized protein n=1 Tax=Acer negundo TaxID=4023 RepID=A0AAD5J7U9_ACENE|nr:hypothetical protein LWI28_000372 [Acer negundo]
MKKSTGVEGRSDDAYGGERNAVVDSGEQVAGQHIDAFMSLLAKRMESEPDEHRHSYVLLSSNFITKVKVEWNKIIEADNEAGSSVDALAYECLSDWIEDSRIHK